LCERFGSMLRVVATTDAPDDATLLPTPTGINPGRSVSRRKNAPRNEVIKCEACR
jgi:hypothetical protein